MFRFIRPSAIASVSAGSSLFKRLSPCVSYSVHTQCFFKSDSKANKGGKTKERKDEIKERRRQDSISAAFSNNEDQIEESRSGRLSYGAGANSIDYTPFTETMDTVISNLESELEVLDFVEADIESLNEFEVSPAKGESKQALRDLSQVSSRSRFMYVVELHDIAQSAYISQQIRQKDSAWRVRGEGSTIYVDLPKPTELTKQDMLKKAKTAADLARGKVRQERIKMKQSVTKLIKNKNQVDTEEQSIQKIIDKKLLSVLELESECVKHIEKRWKDILASQNSK